LRSFFYPENIAVFGVSDRSSNFGRIIVGNLVRSGFKGGIFPIGGHAGTVEGRPIYTSLAEVEQVPDLAVLLVTASQVPDILEECGKKGIRHVIVESAGFTELGEDKKGLEDQIRAVIAKWSIELQGPNCFGTMNIENGVMLPFFETDSRQVKKGAVSFVAQSGGLFYDTYVLCSVQRVGLGKLTSIGNKLNLNENDFVEYLISDPATNVIGMYLENFSDGRRLMELASSTDKPFVLVKGNRGQEASEIAHFHTTALAGDDKVADSAMAQAGIHRVNNTRELIDGLKVFSLPLLKGPSLAIMTRSGGHGVLAADAVGRYGFKLAKFPDSLLEKVAQNKRQIIRMTNPLDVGDIYDTSTYPAILEMMLKEEGVDGVVFVSAQSADGENKFVEKFVREAARMSSLYGKPVVLCVISARDFGVKDIADIPIFRDVDDALQVLSWSLAHSRYQEKKRKFGSWSSRGAEKSVFQGAGTIMGPGEAFGLLAWRGLPVAPHALAASAAEAAAAADGLGYPVAVKMASPNLLHKTEKGGVALGLGNAGAVKEAAGRMEAEQYLVQKMAPAGHEVIVGGRQDREFGPVVLFGLGGVFVEVLKDTSIRVAPIGRQTAYDMIAEVKGAPMLQGFRGKPAADIEALADVLVAVSKLLAEDASICNIDINPVIVGEKGKGCVIVDAKIEKDNT
jgi:acetyltransferase